MGKSRKGGGDNITGEGIFNTNSFQSDSAPTIVTTDSGTQQQQKETTPALPAVIRSDTNTSNTASTKTTSRKSRNEYPAQISYQANASSNNGHSSKMIPPPPLSPQQQQQAPVNMTAPVSGGGISSPWLQHGSNQFASGMTVGYPPPMHSYQLSSSPVMFTTHQAPGGIAYSSPGGGNFPSQMLNGSVHNVGGLPPTPPTTMQYQHPQQQQQQQDMSSVGGAQINNSNNKRRPAHRRANSYNGPQASSLYGSMDASISPSMFSNSGGAPLPRHPGQRSGSNTPTSIGRKRSNSAEFSPVSEIRKLTGSIPRPPASPRSQPPGGGVPRGHFRTKSEDWQGRISPMQPQMFPMPLSANTSPLQQQHQQYYPYQQRQQQQQQQQQQQPMMYNRGVYMGGDDGNISPFSGSMRNIHGNTKDMNINDDGSDAGGEAVFLLSKKSSHNKSTRRESRKQKRHMRQRSAQLFMENVKGTEQLPSCRDIIFLLLFVFHILGIVYLGRTYGNEALRVHDESPEDSESSVTIIFTNLIYIAGFSGLFAIVVSGFTLLLMTNFPNKIVQIALILTITFSFVWGTIGIGLSPKKIVPVTGIIALAMSVAYAFIVWDRMPFATANLNAGLTGILANPGAVFVSFIFQILATVSSIYYVFVAFGVYDAIQVGVINESFEYSGYIYYCLLGISYYWTLHVFLNIVQVTVTDVIGKWWYEPEGDTSHRIADLKHAFFRSLFYSIGSICFGSLFVGPVRILRQLSVFFRPSEGVDSLMTLHECMHVIQSGMTSCVDKLGVRFSHWSYTYVGLYGYSLMDAGLQSAELFERRGWTTIVSDDLVPNVLLLITIAIAGLTGLFAHLLEQFESLSLTATGEPVITSFVAGGCVGLVVSSVLFGIISSSVNAVIVLFAASPVDFEQNHPKLSEEMRNAWREVWPGCMDVLDMRVQVAGFLDPTLNGSVRGTDMYFNPAMNDSFRGSERHPLLP